ncbi:HTH-type transcriptional regulator KdgR [Rhodovastum atsumiense]|uniref:LacI family transcriptional regulator n=1 Tax=Rhodovastum atsumiense TaxID=504468 RepID=A0A5M6IKY0_9PROT|nr:LacI family DNA-binding transcriptional regulator [Rhodovastum atsumiense]KAA5608228.1 LacI family transcriptional regulator [Rhodovastum atsumiense]CAH2599379.1 HTH-type transcriptional regulator KdgR [Rhodovastum atsumiense]
MSRGSPAEEYRIPVGRATTIVDVAERAGVSKATVSRYLSGKSEVLSEATWKQIEDAVAALNYRPSQIARSLKGGHTRLIGMVVADVTNPYSVAVLKGAEDECQRAGYMLALCNSGGSPEKEQLLLAGLRAYRIEGLILNLAGPGGEKVPEAMPADLPVVLLDRHLPAGRFDFVGLDNIAAMGEATRHLVGNGYRDLMLLAEPLRGVSVRIERGLGFREAVAAAGCSGEVCEVDLRQEGAMGAALARFMAGPDRGPRAVIAASGLVTLRTVQAMQALGLRMPGDLAVVGFDELEWSSLVGPGITTIAQPTYDIGIAVVRSLLARLATHNMTEPRSTIFTGRLVVRGSSAPAGAARHVRPAGEG